MGLDGFSRRDALKGAALLSLLAGPSVSAEPVGTARLPANAKTLVVYYSRTGNTRVVAGQLSRALGSDLFELQTVDPYPEDYEATVKQAQRERDAGYKPPLKPGVPALSLYSAVLLGFPIWGMSAPPVIKSFLSGHDLSGKSLMPFVTHGGYGLGSSMADIAEHAPQAELLEGFSMKADQERETLSQVTQWLSNVKPRE